MAITGAFLGFITIVDSRRLRIVTRGHGRFQVDQRCVRAPLIEPGDGPVDLLRECHIAGSEFNGVLENLRIA